MPSIYDLASNYDMGSEQPVALPVPAAPIQQPEAPASMAPTPAIAPTVGSMQPGGNQQLLSLLGRYFPQGEDYGRQIKTAQAAHTKESQAFTDMIQKAMSAKGEAGPDKAEMYFRLAAAFGAPTRTGKMSETIGNVGATSADILKERRAAEQAARTQNLQLGLEAQKMRMQGTKEDLATLRQLQAEGMKDKRTIATELIKDYVKSGQPESTAGKQAKDEGLTPGTPEYQKRVSQIADMNVDKQMAQINATLANMGTAQANLALAQQKFEFQQGQASKLTPGEMKLKTETEDTLAQTQQAYENLKKAMALNPNTFDTSLPDTAQRKLLEAAGSKDKKLQDTREMENLLEKAALSQLKSTFPGAISNDERKALMATQGLGAKSIEERGKIMQNAATAMQAIYQRSKKRLNEINQGLYRETNIGGGE
jgi:hypothetical protein